MQYGQLAVFRAEVVAPVRNAVGLINHEQAQARHEKRQPLLAERRVVEPLGANQEHVELVGFDLLADAVPLGDVR